MHADRLFSFNDPVLLAKCLRVYTFSFQLDSGHPNAWAWSMLWGSALSVSHDRIATH